MVPKADRLTVDEAIWAIELHTIIRQVLDSSPLPTRKQAWNLLGVFVDLPRWSDSPETTRELLEHAWSILEFLLMDASGIRELRWFANVKLRADLTSETAMEFRNWLSEKLQKAWTEVGAMPLRDAVRLLDRPDGSADSPPSGTRVRPPAMPEAAADHPAPLIEGETAEPVNRPGTPIEPAAASTGGNVKRGDRKRTNARVQEELDRNPDATSEEVGHKVHRKPQTVRATKAWKAHQARLEREKSKGTDAMDHARPLTEPMLASIGSATADPATLAAEREGQIDLEAIEPIELLRRKYLEGATADERARFNRLNPADQEGELQAWKWSGIRLAE
jgi:hypothetical protein